MNNFNFWLLLSLSVSETLIWTLKFRHSLKFNLTSDLDFRWEEVKKVVSLIPAKVKP